MDKKGLVIWGASGHALAICNSIDSKEFFLQAFIDRNTEIKKFLQTDVFNSFEEFKAANKKLSSLRFLIAIGGSKGEDRIEIHKLLKNEKLIPYTFIHPSAWVDKSVKFAEGVQVLGMAAISAEVSIGSQTIVNTNATVDHETEIGFGCHIMPSAAIAGCSIIGNHCTIGTNATILPRIKIVDNVYVGAGAVVTRDILKPGKYVGIPARSL